MSLDLDFVPADGSVPSVALLWSLIDDVTGTWRGLIGALPDEAVRWQPAPQSHSIGAVLLHVADSDQYWVEEVALGRRRGPEALARVHADRTDVWAGRWAPPPAMGLDDFYALNDELRAGHRAATASLDPRQRFAFDDGTCTLAWILKHLASHNAYHYGQVALLAHLWNAR